jgi:hypothetical protein
MFKRQGIGVLILLIAALWLAGMACRLGAQGTTSTPTAEAIIPKPATQAVKTPFPVQTTAPQQAATQPPAVLPPPANPGKLTITIDEAQLNTMIVNELNRQSSPQLTNPKIHLQNGQILVSGEVNRSGLNASFSGTLTVDVTPDGHIQFNVISASLGPLPLPQAMRDQLATQLNAAMGAPQTSDGQQIYVEAVNIGDGVMTITGHIR